MGRLDGRVAIISGGARGQGAEEGRLFASEGAAVVLTDVLNVEGEQVATEIGGVFLHHDVTSEEAWQDVVNEVVEQHGKVDILINNAGNVVSLPNNAPLEKRPTELWHDTMNVNLHGTFYCTKHTVAKAMKPAGGGVIINLGSTAGIVGKDRRVYQGTDMGGATIDYHAAKGGVINMTRDLAVYLAPDNIRVNCISPGGFFRNQPEPFVEAFSATIPMGRMGQDGKELKGAAVFLASEASSYVTGHNLVVDGGLTIW